MNDLTDIEAALRKQACAQRREAHGADVAAMGGSEGEASRSAMGHFLASGLHIGAEVISGYRPIRTEIDPTQLMKALYDAGHRLCVPVIQGRGLALKFREWRPGAEMVEGEFGAFVPATGDWLDPHLLITPLVAFDAAGWRLGYGGGFYDRSLQELRARRRTLAVGFAYNAQQVDAVPRDASDQPLDAIVTEQGVLRPAQVSHRGQR